MNIYIFQAIFKMRSFKVSLVIFRLRLVVFKNFFQFRINLLIILDTSWHDFAETELDVLLVLILFRLHDELIKELESVLALVDAGMLNRNL